MSITETEAILTRGRGRRPRRTTAADGGTTRPSIGLNLVMILMAAYIILPLFWLVVSSTKTQEALLGSFGLWFSGDFALWDNIVETVTYNDGEFARWMLNTVIYVVIGAGGATLLALLAGYGLALFDFPGKRGVIVAVLAAIAIPGTALAVPTFLLFSNIGLANTAWSIIVPSLINPFGMYLVWTFARESVPRSLVEAARIDGAGEFRIFFSIVVRLLAPAFVTVLLFSIVTTWNNYFLPLIMLSDPNLYPITVGLNQWNAQASTVGGQPIYNLVITGSLLAIIPIVAVFLLLQRYWQSGLAAGSVK